MTASRVLSGKHHKRSRRTKAQITDLRDTMLGILRDEHPNSVRHTFYEMTNPRLSCAVEKSEERGYKTVQHQLAQMRKLGLLPYGWIVDATRRGYFVNTYSNAADFMRSVAGLYRVDVWKQSDHYVEVWCESRSIAGVIQGTCKEYGVSLYPAGGFASLTLSYDAAAYIDDVVNGTDKSIEILYIGDYDPAGVLIDRDIEAKLRSHLRTGNPLTFHRLAINEGQIAEYDLPTKPRKKSEKRAQHIRETVEAEAMPANMLRRLLREKIESYLPEQALRVAKVAEESERDYIRILASLMEGKDGND